jgi:hypothetical protein
MEWVLMEEKGKNGDSDEILTTRLQMLGARRGCEMVSGKSFTVLMLMYGMRPQHLLLYGKRMVIRLGDGL